jgi:hypothetical protein
MSAPELAPDAAAAGLSLAPEGETTRDADLTALAAVVDPEAFINFTLNLRTLTRGWEFEARRHHALVVARRVLGAGYRLSEGSP